MIDCDILVNVDLCKTTPSPHLQAQFGISHRKSNGCQNPYLLQSYHWQESFSNPQSKMPSSIILMSENC